MTAYERARQIWDGREDIIFKYREGMDIEPSDLACIRNLEKLGKMHIGMSLRRNQQLTAKPTLRGMTLIEDRLLAAKSVQKESEGYVRPLGAFHRVSSFFCRSK